VTRTLSGQLRVGAEQCLGVVDVPELLERFHTRYPHVGLHFTQAGSYELLDLLRGGSLDAAFVATASHLGTMNRIEIARSPIVLLCPPGHPIAQGGRLRWEDLDGQDFIDFHQSWAVRAINDDVAKARGVHRVVRCTVNDIHTLLDLVHRGLGIAMVPEPVATKPQAAGLVAIQLPQPHADWAVSVVTLNNAPINPASRYLLELMAQTAQPRVDARRARVARCRREGVGQRLADTFAFQDQQTWRADDRSTEGEPGRVGDLRGSARGTSARSIRVATRPLAETKSAKPSRPARGGPASSVRANPTDRAVAPTQLSRLPVGAFSFVAVPPRH
jgi:DNA-binding transcriptional LysR family regulator